MIILGFVSCVIWPTATTRALAMKDHHAVKKQYLWSSRSFLIRFIIPCFLGIAAYVYIDGGYLSGVDLSSKTDQLKAMPLLLKNILPVGLLGFAPDLSNTFAIVLHAYCYIIYTVVGAIYFMKSQFHKHAISEVLKNK